MENFREVEMPAFSSLFIGTSTATLTVKQVVRVIDSFQFPLHRDINCNKRRI